MQHFFAGFHFLLPLFEEEKFSYSHNNTCKVKQQPAGLFRLQFLSSFFFQLQELCKEAKSFETERICICISLALDSVCCEGHHPITSLPIWVYQLILANKNLELELNERFQKVASLIGLWVNGLMASWANGYAAEADGLVVFL